MLLINPAARVLHVPLVLEEVVEKTFVIEVCTVLLYLYVLFHCYNCKWE